VDIALYTDRKGCVHQCCVCSVASADKSWNLSQAQSSVQVCHVFVEGVEGEAGESAAAHQDRRDILPPCSAIFF
jgi:hypothetical protein